MAIQLLKSKNVVSHFRSKLGFLAITNQPTCWNSHVTQKIHTCQRSILQNLENPHGFSCKNQSFLSFHRWESTMAEKHLNITEHAMDYPGGKVKYTSDLSFISGSPEERIPCYRVLDEDGHIISSSNFIEISKEVAVKMYMDMVTLQVMDTIFYEAQRQGRISFYLTCIGEEAINIASAAALNFEDLVFPQVVMDLNKLCTIFHREKKCDNTCVYAPILHVHAWIHTERIYDISSSFCLTTSFMLQYREPGVLLWRGFTIQEFANQLLGNKSDYGKGKQMPIHYGSNKHNYITVSSTVGTQIPQAVGAAYSLKMDGKDACAITYFGDGGSSTGDFHAGLNFAAVMEAPVILFCRNNGWAISTPVADQFRSDGIVSRGQAYGIRSIRVDGHDAVAIYTAVHEARQMAIKEGAPVLIEALTYRAGHHSTSDDSTRYRSAREIEWWRGSQDPVSRFRKYIERKGWWSTEAESELRTNTRKQIAEAIQVAERSEKPPVADIFQDVYDVVPSNLGEQERLLRETISRHSKDYPSDVPV